MTFTQEHRLLAVETVLGPDAVLVAGLTGSETVSAPFHFTLDLRSDNAAHDLAQIVGTRVCVTIALSTGGARRIHGIVSRFRQGATGTALATYQADVVPWLWMLSLSTDCRIFQKMSVPDIVAQVFKDLGYNDFKFRLVQNHAPREYCVQYRETHLDFVSRLLEDEGIFYFFEHEADRHVLVLCDGPATVKASEDLPALTPAPSIRLDARDDVFMTIMLERAVHSRSVTLTDYNYLTPSTTLEASMEARDGMGEIFEYPGGYAKPAEGDHYARLRLETAEAQSLTVTGTSAAPALTSGCKVDITGRAAGDAQGTWFVRAVTHKARQGGFQGASDGDVYAYENAFVLHPASVPWRPPRRTPRPQVHGTQSALVVGKAGEEIWTDEHGRVKLHFYWDRQGKRDENSSCWVRCSSAWAGRGYGQFSVPRIGQEVLVDFVDGNPDRPVVVGRVFNPDQPPPCDPGGARGVVSGLRTKTHKGTGYNAIEMNDTAGKEMMSIHAQHDLDTVVEHNETRTVKTGTQSVTVKGDTSLTIQAGNRIVRVSGGDYDVSATAAAKLHGEGAGVQITGEANGVTVTGTGGVGVEIGGTPNVEITADAEAYLGAPATTVEGTTSCDVTSPSVYVHGGTDLAIDSPDIDIGAGKIVIHGTTIVLEAGGGSITIDGSGISISGNKINASASGTHEISGGLVKIN